MKSSLIRKSAAASIVALGFAFLSALYAINMRNVVPGRVGDFIEYWSAAQQLTHHANPYNRQEMLALQQAQGYDRNGATLTPSLPVAYLILLPLGLMKAKTALVVWGLALFACLSITLRLLWSINGNPETYLYLAGYLFAPELACFLGGQIGIFFGLSIVLFLYFFRRNPLLAGMALLPCAMKPHLFLVVGLVLLLWSIQVKSFRVIGGFALALALSQTVVLCLNPHIWQQYIEMWHSGEVQSRYTPGIGAWIRQAINPGAHWIEGIPTLLGCGWGAWYFWTRRSTWDWTHQGLLVLLVSKLCAPYSWFTDEAMLLPAVLTGVVMARKSAWRVLPTAICAAIALLEVLQAVDVKSNGYLWTTPAWIACYLVATTTKSTAGNPVSAAQATTSGAHS